MSIINFSDTIIAKSDQLNAADIAGEMTITITDAKKQGGADQPVSIYYEGGGNKPWKPCKTVRRILAQVWGVEADLKGKKVTLINDPTVTWAGQEVGGIRVVAMSGIDKEKTVIVRSSKTKVSKVVIKPILGAQNTSDFPQEPDNDIKTDHFIRAGLVAAQSGVSAYKEWLSTLDADVKLMIRHKHKEWSEIAKQADTEEDFPL